jgi:hypothetical protein
MQKELKCSNKEIIIIGIVREIGENWKSHRIGIVNGSEIYVVKLNEEGKNLLYEVGNKVEATGIVSKTKKGELRIAVTGYRVYEMDEDDLDDYGSDPDYYLSEKYKLGE